jgi:D-alanyl-D-alanine carboxypeptidase (penicillin-binding protein 5/6)
MKILFRTVFAAYLLVLTWLVLFKFSLDLGWVLDAHTQSLNLIPFAPFEDFAESARGMLDNLLIFIPFGLLLAVNFKDVTFRRKLMTVMFFSISVELIQLLFAIGISDITDVIMNTAGGLAGLLIYGAAQRRMSSKRLDLGIAVLVSLILIAACSILFTHRVMVKMRGPSQPLSSQTQTKGLAKDAQLTWPAHVGAAVGSVEDGPLAQSSSTEEARPTASMAKVIMALAIMKKQPLSLGKSGPSYVITAHDVAVYEADAAKGGSVMPVQEGMVLTQYQALQAMLIPSANNIADMLAEKIFGSKQAYVAYAQDMVERMGLSQTVVADASGFSPLTRSTPSEMVLVGIAALKNPVIAEIVAQPQASIPDVGVIKNTNELLADGAIGIKTGTTDSAGSCLLFAKQYTTSDGQNVTLVGVVMGDADAKHLFDDSRSVLASAQQAYDLSLRN